MNTGSPESGRDVVPPMDACWRHVGTSGDGSCPELVNFIHCRNCPVVAAAARSFFDRPPPAGYLESWQEMIEQPVVVEESGAKSVLVFRLGDEWLALPIAALIEVTLTRPVHHLPHRSSTALEGLVNIRGQLQLCARLGGLLGSDGKAAPAADPTTERFLVIGRTGEGGLKQWVLRVDQVADIYQVHRSSLRSMPATVTAAGLRPTAALFPWQSRLVGLLDADRLLDSCGRILSG
ncbi:MAG: chemotaxis protein CheW [Planctomycetota bacterium]